MGRGRKAPVAAVLLLSAWPGPGSPRKQLSLRGSAIMEAGPAGACARAFLQTCKLTAVGFEPTQLALVELESTPLDHSGKLSVKVVKEHVCNDKSSL